MFDENPRKPTKPTQCLPKPLTYSTHSSTENVSDMQGIQQWRLRSNGHNLKTPTQQRLLETRDQTCSTSDVSPKNRPLVQKPQTGTQTMPTPLVFYSTTYNPAINHCDLQRADNINIGSTSKAMNNSGIFSQIQLPSLLTKNAKNLRECSSGLTFPSPQQLSSKTILVPLRN